MVFLAAGSADEWQDVVSTCFVPLTCLAFEDAFTGTMLHTSLDDHTSVSLVTTSGTSAERTARSARHATSDDLHLSLQVSSTGIVSQDGQRAVVRPGSVTTYATDRAYHLDYSQPGQQQLIIQVSRSSLGLPVEMIESSCRRLRMPGISSARVLFDYVARLQRDGAASVSYTTDAQTTRDLAAAMIRSSYSAEPAMPRTDQGLLATIEDYMLHNASRQSLTVEEVAVRHGISRRKLYALFAAGDQTPADFIRRRRLRGAADMLTAVGRRLSVPEVAYAAGFADPDVFTRAFRREYGCTPRDYRSRPPGQAAS